MVVKHERESTRTLATNPSQVLRHGDGQRSAGAKMTGGDKQPVHGMQLLAGAAVSES